MKTKQKISVMLAALFAMGTMFWVSTGDAEAKRWRKKRRGGCMKMLMRAPGWKLKKKLGLSDAQVGKLKQMKASFVTTAIPLRGKIQLQRFKIRQLMDNQQVDQAKVLAAVSVMNTLRGQMKLLRVKKKLQLRALITPQQRQKMRKMCRRRMRRFRRHRWGRRGHRMGRRHRRMGRRHRMGRRGRWGRRGRRGWGGRRRHKMHRHGQPGQPTPDTAQPSTRPTK